MGFGLSHSFAPSARLVKHSFYTCTAFPLSFCNCRNNAYEQSPLGHFDCASLNKQPGALYEYPVAGVFLVFSWLGRTPPASSSVVSRKILPKVPQITKLEHHGLHVLV